MNNFVLRKHFKQNKTEVISAPPFSRQVAYSVIGHTDIPFQYLKLMTVRTAGQGLRNGVAVRGFMSGRGPTRSGGKDSPNGSYRSAGPGRQPSQNFVPRKRFKPHQMHQIEDFVP